VDSFHGCEIEGRSMQSSRSLGGRRFQFAVHYTPDATRLGIGGCVARAKVSATYGRLIYGPNFNFASLDRPWILAYDSEIVSLTQQSCVS
jgi:hypothetical protein